MVADESESTLLKFRRQRVFRAENGGRGGANKRHGATGKNTVVTVPVGTEVWDVEDDELLGDSVGSRRECRSRRGWKRGCGQLSGSCRRSTSTRCLRRQVRPECNAGCGLN